MTDTIATVTGSLSLMRMLSLSTIMAQSVTRILWRSMF